MDAKLVAVSVGLLFSLAISVGRSNAQGSTVCSKPADVGILLDASGSIGRRRWQKVVQFTRALVNAFNVSREGSHVAIILYATKTKIKVGFNTFFGDEWTAENINQRVEAVDYSDWKGMTYIDRGLKTANEELFTYENGMRRDKEIEKILILFTDGKQTKDRDPYTELDIAAQPIKDKGIEIYALGVGKSTSIDVPELQRMASKPGNVFTADSFDKLEPLAIQITQASCDIPPPPRTMVMRVCAAVESSTVLCMLAKIAGYDKSVPVSW